MAQLVFEIKNQWISRTDTFKPVAKSKNYLYAQFNFLTDEWVGVPTAIFRNKTSAYEQIIGQDGTCLVPWEVIDVEGDSEIFVSVFCGDLVTANKARVHVYDTGYGDDLESDTPPTPSVYEQILNRMAGIEEDMDNATQRAESAAESAEYAAEHYPIIIDGYWYVWDVTEREYVNTYIKAEGHDGTSATVEVEQIIGGHRVTITDVSGEHVFDVPDGRDGTDGRGIASLEKTSTSGDVDQYTMTFSDGSEPFVYYVTNGASATISTRAITNGYRLTITDKNGTRSIDVLNGAKGDPGNGIYSIDKTGSYENYDYYEIRMTNGNKSYFTVTNGAKGDKGDPGQRGATGNGIASIAKTGTSGLVDTYTITYTNGQTTTFDVTNGETPTVDAGDVPYDDTETYSNGSVGKELSSVKADISDLSSSLAPVESTATATAAHAVGELFMMGETLLVALSAIAIGDTITTEGGSPNAAVTKLTDKLIKDVQVNGTSVVTSGIGNVPLADMSEAPGVVKMASGNGLTIDGTILKISSATSSLVKEGTNIRRPIVPSNQHNATFYGLAKASGDTTQSASSNAVGVYTDAAKASIQSMLGVSGDYALVADLTTTAEVTSDDGITVTFPHLTKQFLIYADVKESTASASLYIVPYNEMESKVFGLGMSGQINTSEKYTYAEVTLLSDRYIKAVYTTTISGNPTMYGKLHYLNGGSTKAFSSIVIRPFNNNANIPIGSVIRVFAR